MDKLKLPATAPAARRDGPGAGQSRTRCGGKSQRDGPGQHLETSAAAVRNPPATYRTAQPTSSCMLPLTNSVHFFSSLLRVSPPASCLRFLSLLRSSTA